MPLHTLTRDYKCTRKNHTTEDNLNEQIKQELKDLKKARAKAEKRAKGWRTIADETFSFASYAEEDFDSYNIENKRKMLAKLGQQSTLLDGKLQFKPNKYMIPVENNNLLS